MFDRTMLRQAEDLLDLYRSHGAQIVTAESCTGGLVAALLTSVAGSSAVVDRGFVTYSNAAKIDLIGVDAEVLESEGAVSRAVAQQMAKGAVARAQAHYSVAVTGVAGPSGGTPEKPVGLVFIATHAPTASQVRECHFGPLSRDEIRRQTVIVALEMLAELLQPAPTGA